MRGGCSTFNININIQNIFDLLKEECLYIIELIKTNILNKLAEEFQNSVLVIGLAHLLSSDVNAEAMDKRILLQRSFNNINCEQKFNGSLDLNRLSKL